VFAQSKQPILIGWLNTDSRELSGHYLTAFKEGLAALGWKEGAQYVIEERWANGRVDRLPGDHLAVRSWSNFETPSTGQPGGRSA